MSPASERSASRSGILFVDKPGSMTSHDVVARVRKLAGTRKVGHAGTLDPMATGLLTLGVGSSTRLLTFLVGLDKEYFATIRLGESTDTDDADGQVSVRAEPARLAALTEPRILDAIAALTGTIRQVPSSVSAIRIGGRRAHDLARAGEAVELAAREVTVGVFELLAIHDGLLDVRVECSSGTYVRALARDLGSSLGVGGHLTALRRTRVGPFDITLAVALEEIDPVRDLVSPAEVAARLFPILRLSGEQALDLANGKHIVDGARDGGPIAAIGPDGRLVGLVTSAAGIVRAIVNFPLQEAG